LQVDPSNNHVDRTQTASKEIFLPPRLKTPDNIATNYAISPCNPSESFQSSDSSLPSVFHVIKDTLITSANQPLKKALVSALSTIPPHSVLPQSSNISTTITLQSPNRPSQYIQIPPSGQDQALDLRGQTQDILSFSNDAQTIQPVHSGSIAPVGHIPANELEVTPREADITGQNKSNIWVDKLDLGSVRIIANSISNFNPPTTVRTTPVAQNSSFNEMTTTNSHPTLSIASPPMQVDYRYSPQYVVVSESTDENNTKLSRIVNPFSSNKQNAFHPSEENETNKMGSYISYQVPENSERYANKNDSGKHSSYSELLNSSTFNVSFDPSKEEYNHETLRNEIKKKYKDKRENGDGVINEDDTSMGDEDFDMSEDHLLKFSVRDLNKILHGLPKNKQKTLKQKRRTLKNRGYAQNCRSKRMVARNDLEVTNTTLHSNMQGMINELENVKKECEMLKEILYKERLEKKNLEDIVRSLRGN
jgi:hypothetical protein